jgi:hypothetical protein
VVALDDGLARPDLTYASASLAQDGFAHCSPANPSPGPSTALLPGPLVDRPGGPALTTRIPQHKTY